MDLGKKIETTANIANIAVATLLSAILIKAYVLPASSHVVPQVSKDASVGVSLKGRVPGINWSKNGRTLVLAMSTQCHFCRDSTPFYGKVQDEVGKGVKIVAVLPQTVTEAEQYLNGEGVRVDQVEQVPMGSIGIRGTPTMLLVNSSGVITKMWVGKIQTEQEQEVLTALRRG